MCGVTGYWAHSSPDISERLFGAFTHSLAHRGPDGSGIEHFREARLWLGHRRLAVVDLSERARQPMSYANRRYWLTYNGEVYNFIELREELRSLGHRFVSDSDGEVILAAYTQWGPECQLRFNGMWAFAIWDARDRQLFLTRDRFGIKPLLYSDHAGAFIFASELKAFLTLPWIDGAFNSEILAETLTNTDGQEGSPYTLLPGVRRLPPGHSLLIKVDGKIQVNCWWNTLEHLPKPPLDLNEQAEEFRSLFFDACRLRMRSDVPLATSLSGGLNSSAVACTLAKLGRHEVVDRAPKDWQRAFVACFTGTPFDERKYAKQVVDHSGMVPSYLDVSDSVALQHIERVLFDHEAIRSGCMVGPWMVYRSMRHAGIRVSLDGQGSDEEIGGYEAFVDRAIDEAAARLDYRRLFDLHRARTGLVGGTEISRYKDLVWNLARAPLLRHDHLRTAKNAALRYLRLLYARGRGIEPRRGDELLSGNDGVRRLYEESSDPRVIGMSPLNSMLFAWFHGSFLPSLLGSFDRASMSYGVEVRLPFMDWRLVTYSFALPETSKIGGGYTKRILRLAMRGILPEPIRLRTKKVGFVSPIGCWSRGALRTWLLDVSASRGFLENPVWNGPLARKAVEKAVSGEGRIDCVWPMINAFVLEQAFKARARVPNELLAIAPRRALAS